MTSRKNAMLTTEDRRWLTGEKSYEGEHAKQQRYQRRRDIRERIYNSMLDFSLVFEHMDGDEREKLFGTPGTEQDRLVEDQAFADGVCDALAFLLYNTGITAGMRSSGDEAVLAERLLAEALDRAGKRDGLVVEDVDLSVEAIDPSRSALLEDLKAGNELSPAELRYLLESEDVDTSAVQERIRAMLFDE
jgi:hypothetical protein